MTRHIPTAHAIQNYHQFNHLRREENDEKQDPVAKDIMKGIQELSVQNSQNTVHLSRIDHAIQCFHAELASLKANMVTKESFVEFESRVDHLEHQKLGSQSQDIKFLRQQVSKLDPAIRALCVRKFKKII